jgi:Ctr copper transporter family
MVQLIRQQRMINVVPLLLLSCCLLPSSTATCSEIVGTSGWKERVVNDLETLGLSHLCLPKHSDKASAPIEISCGGHTATIPNIFDSITSDLMSLHGLPMEIAAAPMEATTQRRRHLSSQQTTVCSIRSWSPTIDQTDSIVTSASSLPTTQNIGLLIPIEDPTSLYIVHRTTKLWEDSKLYYTRTFTAAGEEDDEDLAWCHQEPGMGRMVMYMRGFHWSSSRRATNSSAASLPCLNYYFSTWGLTDKGAFQGAMVFSFLLALLTQGVSAIRAVVMKHVIRRRKRKVMLLFLYVLQSFMGYMIMLIAMTYSWELLLSVVFGVMMGNRLFVKGDEYELKQQQTMRREGDVATTMQEPLLAATNE